MASFKREQESQVPEPDRASSIIDPKGNFGNFGGCDLELFRTGAHADVRVFCEGREFPVHKAVLASRSGWFQEMLSQMEQQQPKVPGVIPTLTITSHKSSDLELVLIFIYAGEVDPKISHDTSFTSSCVRLYDLGHDFSVAGMADFATDELGNYLSMALKMISDQRLSRRRVPAGGSSGGGGGGVAGRTEIQDRLRENNFVSMFLLGVEAADAIRRAPGRGDRERPFQMLVDFFVAGKEVLLAEPETELFLDGDVVPSFARSVLLTERRGGARSRWMRGLVAPPPAPPARGRAGLCCDCGRGLKNLAETGGPGLVNPRSRVVTYAQVCCALCSEKERNIGEHDLVKWEVFDPRKD